MPQHVIVEGEAQHRTDQALRGVAARKAALEKETGVKINLVIGDDGHLRAEVPEFTGGVPGMPNVIIGMKEVWAAALLAASGAATPRMFPLPKVSGFRELFFSSM